MMRSAFSRSGLVAVGESVGLALSSCIAAVASALGIGVALQGFGLLGTDVAFVIQYTGVQVGFLALAAGYLVRKGDWKSYVDVRRPTARDIGWIAAIPTVMVGVSLVLEPLLVLLGLPSPDPPVMDSPDVLEQPALLLLVVVWWYLVAAPSEELLFRGIIQGRLRRTFTAGAGIGLAAIVFTIPHVVFVLLERGISIAVLTQFVQMLVGGLVFGIAYERTDNLVVPSVGHALMWSMILFVV